MQGPVTTDRGVRLPLPQDIKDLHLPLSFRLIVALVWTYQTERRKIIIDRRKKKVNGHPPIWMTSNSSRRPATDARVNKGRMFLLLSQK